MNKRIIVTDSASDICAADEKQYGIKVLSYKIAINGSVLTSRVDFTNDEFYAMLEKSAELPLTSQITPFEFTELFESLYGAGVEEVICVLINSKGSATYNNCIFAYETFLEDNPDAQGKFKVYPVDGRSYTCAYGFPTVEAAKMLINGTETETVLQYLNDYMSRSIIYAGLYTLKYAAKSGRIPSAAAFVGDAIGMKPIMRICDNSITTGDKVRGEKNIIPFIAKKLAEYIVPGEPYCVVYGIDDEIRDLMAQAAESTVGYPPAAFYKIGAAIAINAGPRVAGISCLRKKP